MEIIKPTLVDVEPSSTFKAPTERLLISVLGPMRVSYRGRDIRVRKHKARALLAYLALTEGRKETRERLVGLLWSESEADKARSSLRQILHELGEDLEGAGFDGLYRDRLRVSINKTDLDVDAQVVLDMAYTGRIHPRLIDERLISDSYLRDLHDVDPSFAVWVKARRQDFHDHLICSLQETLRTAPEDLTTRQKCAQAILNLDPAHEEACRVFMRLSAEIGDMAAAQRAYNALRDLLKKEYDIEPSVETIALIADIKPASAPSSPDAVDASTIERRGEAASVPVEVSAQQSEGRSMPDLDMAKAILAVLARWDIPEDAGSRILGSERAEHVTEIAAGATLLDTRDLRDRAKIFFDIFEGVYSLLQDPTAERDWIRFVRPDLQGQSILALMTEGSQRNLLRAQAFIDYVNGR